jgi:hypothetical protein
MRRRVLFRLSMPSRGSWNGAWPGAERNYVIVRQLAQADIANLFGDKAQASWFHRWDDGWTACVSGRLMDTGERAPKSDGFCGYDWMVDNIIRYGSSPSFRTSRTPTAPVP